MAWSTTEFTEFARWLWLHFDTGVTLVRRLIHDERETLIHHIATIMTTKQAKQTLSIFVRVPSCAAEPLSASILVWHFDTIVKDRQVLDCEHPNVDRPLHFAPLNMILPDSYFSLSRITAVLTAA